MFSFLRILTVTLKLLKGNYSKIWFKIYLAKIFRANRSFAHLPCATWANCSRLLICLERPEQFAQGRSFFLTDLSESLTVLIWFERNEQMSEWANSRPWFLASPSLDCYKIYKVSRSKKLQYSPTFYRYRKKIYLAHLIFWRLIIAVFCVKQDDVIGYKYKFAAIISPHS